MSTIQEALRELKSQRKLTENKTSKKAKILKEATSHDYNIDDYLEDLAEDSFRENNYIGSYDYFKEMCREEGFPDVSQADFSKYKKLCRKLKNKAEDKPVQEALVDEDGDVEKTDFNLAKTCNGANCNVNEDTQKPVMEGSVAAKIKALANRGKKALNKNESVNEDMGPVDQDGDVENISFNLAKFNSGVNESLEDGEADTKEVKIIDSLITELSMHVRGQELKDALLKSGMTEEDINAFVDPELFEEDEDVEPEEPEDKDSDFDPDQFEDADIEIAESYKLNEDLQSSMPVQALPENEVIDFINNVPLAKGVEKDAEGNIIAKAQPVCFFKLGYFKEIEVASRYRGGKGSAGNPFVRIFKAIEYNKLYTGADYENLGAVKQYRKETGIERSGEKTGFSYNGEGTTVNKIGTYANGDKALQAYLANNCQTKTKYYISLDNGDLQEASREEIAQYLTPANANKLLNPTARPKTVERSTNAESGEETVVFNPQAVNRLKIANIYMIGNLGHSIF